MVDGRPEPGRPEDRVDALEAAVGPAHPVGLDPLEHRQPLVRAEPRGLLLLGSQRQPRHAHHARRRQPAAYALLDRGHRGEPGGGVELLAPHRLRAASPRACRSPARARRGTARPTRHRRRRGPACRGSARRPGSARCAPAPPRTSRCRGRTARTAASTCPLALTRVRVRHSRSPARTTSRSPVALDAVDPHRSHHRQALLALVVTEVVGHHRVGGAPRAAGCRRAGQVGDAVHVGHAQRRPAVLPGATGLRVGVEHDVVDAALAQEVRRREAGLAGADDHASRGPPHGGRTPTPKHLCPRPPAWQPRAHGHRHPRHHPARAPPHRLHAGPPQRLGRLVRPRRRRRRLPRPEHRQPPARRLPRPGRQRGHVARRRARRRTPHLLRRARRAGHRRHGGGLRRRPRRAGRAAARGGRRRPQHRGHRPLRGRPDALGRRARRLHRRAAPGRRRRGRRPRHQRAHRRLHQEGPVRGPGRRGDHPDAGVRGGRVALLLPRRRAGRRRRSSASSTRSPGR